MVSPGELETFRHELKGIAEEMGVTLHRTAYSTNVKIRLDHTCGLFDAKLRHVAQHDIAPQHIGSLVKSVPHIIEEQEEELKPGDGLLLNDPYKGAVHLPDILLVTPLFYEDEIVGYAASDAHHVDVGGPSAGGVPPDSTEIYAEGLIIPGVKAVRDWEFDSEIFKLITRNIRLPEMRMGDYRAQLGANKIAQKRYAEFLEKHGVEETAKFIDELLDYTERRVRAAIEDIPDGTYTASDYFDGDGVVNDPFEFTLHVTVDGDEMSFDFSDAPNQRKGPLNATPAQAFAACIYPAIALIGSNLPKNDGFYRPFEINTPEGSMVNPTPPSPVAGGWEVALRVGDLVIKAMSEAVPERAIAGTKAVCGNFVYSGRDPRSDEQYVHYESLAGGYGGRATKDGIDAIQPHFQNTANSPIEELETEAPLYVRRYELIPDSHGPGRQRGGVGLRRDLEYYDHEGTFTTLSDRVTHPPWGIFGGGEARPARFIINPDGDDPNQVNSKSTTDLEPGDVVSLQMPGGGGYGDPMERDPEAVLDDIINGLESEAFAREYHGVVVDTDAREVAEEATRKLREAARADRGDDK